MDGDAPRVSILIPNYDNGRESSRSGRRPFLENLLASLASTLEDDPTPLEIVIVDDGSTDDSLATCRSWAARSWGGWRGDAPFCRLIEREHCGVLSRVANRLTEEARGEICCRLDGDIEMLTPRWAEKLAAVFDDGPPSLGVVGPKQLGLDGFVHSAGSFILHPRGHHHVGQGSLAQTVTRAMEVDHVMGCFYGHRRAIWERIGGYDETLLRGQTVDFGLRARLAGWRTFSVPHIEFVHAHADRVVRANRADTQDGLRETLARFESKWGFDRLAPDLDEVAQRYAGTPLLWNASVFGPRLPWPPPVDGPCDIRRSDWARFAGDERFRAAVLARVAVVEDALAAVGPRRRVLQVGSRGGLLCHLLAQRGLECVGIEPDAHLVDLARRACAGETYPGPAPKAILQTDPRRFPVESGAFDLVLLVDVLETQHNPVGVLREAHGALAPDGIAVIVAALRTAPLEPDVQSLHAYRPHELRLQVQHTGRFTLLESDRAPEVPGSVVVVARRRAASALPAQPSADAICVST